MKLKINEFDDFDKLEKIEKYIQKYCKKNKVEKYFNNIRYIERPETSPRLVEMRKLAKFGRSGCCNDYYYILQIWLNQNEEYKKNLFKNKTLYLRSKAKLENQLLELLNNDESLIYLVNKNGENLGMIAARYKLPRIVDYFLDIKEFANLTDVYGYNLGMIAAENMLEEQTIKALKNKQAALTQSKYFKENIGIIAARNHLVNATSIALENKELCVQQSTNGVNVGMACCYAELGEDLAIKALSNKQAAVQQTKNGGNIGMFCAKALFGTYKKATLFALSNQIASLQQDYLGNTIGMIAAKHYMKDATLKALDNKKASLIQNKDGMTIGMLAAQNYMKEATLKALQNEKVLTLKDKKGWDIQMYAYWLTKDKEVGKRIEKYEKKMAKKRQKEQEEYNRTHHDDNFDPTPYMIAPPPVCD